MSSTSSDAEPKTKVDDSSGIYERSSRPPIKNQMSREQRTKFGDTLASRYGVPRDQVSDTYVPMSSLKPSAPEELKRLLENDRLEPEPVIPKWLKLRYTIIVDKEKDRRCYFDMTVSNTESNIAIFKRASDMTFAEFSREATAFGPFNYDDVYRRSREIIQDVVKGNPVTPRTWAINYTPMEASANIAIPVAAQPAAPSAPSAAGVASIPMPKPKAAKKVAAKKAAASKNA